MVKVYKAWDSWEYKNLTFLIVGLAVTGFLSQQPWFKDSLMHLGGLSYLGAFIAGMMFVSVFTVSIGILILVLLATQMPIIPLGIVASFGAVLGDMLIFKFIKDGLVEELKQVQENIEDLDVVQDGLSNKRWKRFEKRFRHTLKTRYFNWVLPVMGIIVLTSPFPDEVGMGLMGISKIKTVYLLGLLSIVKPISIFMVILASDLV